MRKSWLFGTILCMTIGVLLWATDAITLQDEWTIYTTECLHGAWAGNVCMGQLFAADRYRFHSLQGQEEVLFWINGSTQPVGKLTQCLIKDGRNWTCKSTVGASKSITLQLLQDYPIHDPTVNTRPFHQISKFMWFLLKCRNLFR